ncbi:MAG: hypothetical protein WCQ49_02475 [Candidatus Saccharibacteria bacterium]
MKPETKINAEQASAANVESLSIDKLKSSSNNTEIILNGLAEKSAERSELGAKASDVSLTTVLPQPVVDDNNDVASTTKGFDEDSLDAGDVDLIEKEWVDKAKKIVAETRDDPHMREEGISKLQVDYLKKRFGKEIGHSGS